MTAAVGTYATGKVFTHHFDQGGTMLDFDPAQFRDVFRRESEKGKALVAGRRLPDKRSLDREVPGPDTTRYKVLLEQKKALLASVRALRDEVATLRKQGEHNNQEEKCM
ncbi:MAG: hypothetical protein J5I98_01720 [Phaeodactylibacter sp.]|nr:hypothetical protein [Phaeodactylibacter sp.]